MASTRYALATLLFLLSAAAGSAGAQPATEPAAGAAEAISLDGSRGTAEGFIADRAIIPGYWQVGTSVSFASAPPSDSDLMLPSTARLGLHGRASLGESFELSTGFALPPKRNEVTDDPPLFGGHVMARWAVHRRQALYARAGADRLLQISSPSNDGAWADAAAGWDGRSFMDRDRSWLAFSWNLGVGTGRALGTGDDAPWLVEGIAGLGLHVRAPLRDQGLGLAFGSDFRFPVANGGRAYWAADAPEINSQVRLDVYSTLFVSLATGWSITATLARRDRGQADSPETILPTLGGGYDQTEFIIGFSYSDIREGDAPKHVIAR
jgi:hypothetical protein